MTTRGRLPSFITEAVHVDEKAQHDLETLDADAASHAEIAALAEGSLMALEDAVSDIVAVEAAHLRVPASMLGSAPARLASIVLEPPERYAPFFARLGQFFDLREDAVIAALTLLRDPRRWRTAGASGASKIVIAGGPAVRSAEASLVRWVAGSAIVALCPRGVERILLIEGTYLDAGGTSHRPGTISELAGGAPPAFTVSASQPCIVACLGSRPAWSQWVLRALGRLSRRSGLAATGSPRA